MVKYLSIAASLIASLAITDLAQARHRRGCSSCSAGGGCPGGVCAMPVAPMPGKYGAVSDAPPAVVASPAPAPAPIATAAQPAPRTYTYSSGRRGLFGWRR